MFCYGDLSIAHLSCMPRSYMPRRAPNHSLISPSSAVNETTEPTRRSCRCSLHHVRPQRATRGRGDLPRAFGRHWMGENDGERSTQAVKALPDTTFPGRAEVSSGHYGAVAASIAHAKHHTRSLGRFEVSGRVVPALKSCAQRESSNRPNMEMRQHRVLCIQETGAFKRQYVPSWM